MVMTGNQIYRAMLKEYPDILDMKQVCQALAISKKTAYRLLKEGNLTGIKVGREYRVPKINMLNYLFSASTENSIDTTVRINEDNDFDDFA